LDCCAASEVLHGLVRVDPGERGQGAEFVGDERFVGVVIGYRHGEQIVGGAEHPACFKHFIELDDSRLEALDAGLGHPADFDCDDDFLIRFLGGHSPVGVMIALVGHMLSNVAWLDLAIAVSILLAMAVTVGLHLWRSSLVLSLAGGTAVHVALATTIAGGLH
jgi:branched-subunit amino acid transport protein AzlD